MNHPEHVAAGEYRQRLQKMLEFARTRYAETDYATFAGPVEAKIKQLEAEIAAYNQSAHGVLSNWLGMQRFVVTRQTRRIVPTIRYNSPPVISVPGKEPTIPFETSWLRPIFTRESID